MFLLASGVPTPFRALLASCARSVHVVTALLGQAGNAWWSFFACIRVWDGRVHTVVTVTPSSTLSVSSAHQRMEAPWMWALRRCKTLCFRAVIPLYWYMRMSRRGPCVVSCAAVRPVRSNVKQRCHSSLACWKTRWWQGTPSS